MSRVPRSRPEHPHPDTADRRQLGEQLLDMVRQWAYSRVTRRANLNRHVGRCTPCSRMKFCKTGRELARLANDCDEQLASLRAQLAAIDAEDQADAAGVELPEQPAQLDLFG